VALKVFKASKASKATRETIAPKAIQAKMVATVTRATQAKTAPGAFVDPMALLDYRAPCGSRLFVDLRATAARLQTKFRPHFKWSMPKVM
jgi:hypothetical protein